MKMREGKILYLSAKDVESANIGMDQVIDAVGAMYVEKGLGRVEMPSKIGIHSRPDAFLHAMPGYIPASRAAGLKWIGTYPENSVHDLPRITGLIILNDDETGLPYCVMDCRWVTAKRTGAKTAVAAGFFARPQSRAVGIIACGVQGRSNLEALALRFKIEQVCAYDVRPEAAKMYASEMSAKLGLNVKVVKTPEEAVRDMDIVVTSGPIAKKPAPVIESDWLKPGAFAAPVDYDSYWKREVLRSADVFATDDVEQMFYHQKAGYFRDIPPREQILDLGDVAAGKVAGRQNDSQRIIAMNLGLALDDLATAPLVYRAAVEKGLGTWLDS
jgi:ornithine cyclodeaminase/alanine dehydrogenase